MYDSVLELDHYIPSWVILFARHKLSKLYYTCIISSLKFLLNIRFYLYTVVVKNTQFWFLLSHSLCNCFKDIILCHMSILHILQPNSSIGKDSYFTYAIQMFCVYYCKWLRFLYVLKENSISLLVHLSEITIFLSFTSTCIIIWNN